MNWLTGIETESVSDSGSSNVVLAVTVLLIVAGVVLTIVTVWFWRNSRPDPDALGPLLVMSDRKFFTAGPIEQRRRLDRARPGVGRDESSPAAMGDDPSVLIADDVIGNDEVFGNDDVVAIVDDESFATVFPAEPDVYHDEYHDDPIDEVESVGHEPLPSAPIDPLLGR